MLVMENQAAQGQGSASLRIVLIEPVPADA